MLPVSSALTLARAFTLAQNATKAHPVHANTNSDNVKKKIHFSSTGTSVCVWIRLSGIVVPLFGVVISAYLVLLLHVALVS